MRALRDQAAEIESTVRASTRPPWLDTKTHPAAQAAGEGLGREQLKRLHEHLPLPDACRDLGQSCPSREAAAVADRSAGVEQAKEERPKAAKLRGEDITITILASRSLGEPQLKEIFALAAGSPRVRVAFRGVAKDEALAAFVRQIHGLLAGIQPVPEVVLDPRPFQAPLVDIAPVLIASGPDGELARVAGLADPQWLLARVFAGARGDLGVRGPVLAVSEPDLIAELKRRLAALDLAKLRERALARYWKQVRFETLPVAARARTRTIDPTITASADLLLADGTRLVRAGDTLNPLDRLPFTERLVVFDATDPRQVRSAVRLGREVGTRRVVYLATRLERRWEGLASVEDVLDAPVYLLTPEVRSRFALERVPAYVEAAGRLFRVAEVPPEGAP
jgi:conjugal transfer pilus assembly protein TraW